MCDVDYLCANFSLPRPLCSRVTPDVRDRRTDVIQKHRLMPPPIGGEGIIILVVSISWLYHCNIHFKDVVKHSNEGQKFSNYVMRCWHCRHALLFRTIYTWPTSAICLVEHHWSLPDRWTCVRRTVCNAGLPTPSRCPYIDRLLQPSPSASGCTRCTRNGRWLSVKYFYIKTQNKDVILNSLGAVYYFGRLADKHGIHFLGIFCSR